jgi:hypothetical protein
MAARRPVFRCTHEVAGRGKWIKRDADARKGQYGDVQLHVQPGASFEVRFGHSWPPEVTSDEAAALDEGLLIGIVQAFLQPSHHLDGCLVVTDSVGYEQRDTTPMSVTLAASQAVADLLKKGGWYGGDDTSTPVVARRA